MTQITPPQAGVAVLLSRYQDAPIGRLNPRERIFRKFEISNPVHQTEAGLVVALFHKTAFSMLTGEPIAYYDLRHHVTGVGKVSDRFIYAIRDGKLTLVERLSRRVIF